MTIWRRLESWLSWFPWYRRQARDADLARELRDDVDLEADEQRAAGLSPEEAAYAAHRALFNTLMIEEDVRAARGFQWLETCVQDVRYAFRTLRKSQGFTTVALIIIAAGIGVNSAVFSVVDAVLLKPLTYPDPQALVQLVTTSNQGPIPVASIPEYDIWQQQSNIFKQVAAYDWGGAGTNLAGGDHPEQVSGMHVTSGYFALFGAHVVAGRTFTTAEDRPNG